MGESSTLPLTNAHTPAFGLKPGPITEVHAFWLAGMSCDGCSIAAVGAQNPSVEQLISASIPGLPKIILHHPVLAVEAGEAFIGPYRLAKEGKLGAPYVVIYEGSVANEKIAASHGGYWSAMGADISADARRSPFRPRTGCAIWRPAQRPSLRSAPVPHGAAFRRRRATSRAPWA